MIKKYIVSTSVITLGLTILGYSTSKLLKGLKELKVTKKDRNAVTKLFEIQAEKYQSRYPIMKGDFDASLVSRNKSELDRSINSLYPDLDYNKDPDSRVGDVNKDNVNGMILTSRSREEGYSPAIISHEMGHAYYARQLGGKVGNAVHGPVRSTISPILKVATIVVAGIILAIVGGKKVNSTLVGLIAAFLMIDKAEVIREFCASKKAMEFMKEAGCTKEQLEEGRSILTTAFGSYLGSALFAAGLGFLIFIITYDSTAKLLGSA